MAAVILTPASVSAQLSSINTFSPYTFYGLGDFHTQGSANLRAMGGASMGYRNFAMPYGVNGIINYTNPASLSATPRNSFHFNFGMEGSNHYLRSTDKNTSFNTFNIRDIAFQTPLYKGIGLGISITPFSSVGYRIQREETDEDILQQLLTGGAIGAKYLYAGTGDVNQAKLSLGWQPVKRLSVGVDMVYYFGKLNRDYTTYIMTRTADAGYINTEVSQQEDISRILWNFGLQYSIIARNDRQLTFGATYNPGGKLNPKIQTIVVNSLSAVQPIDNGLAENFEMPAMISAGFMYQTWKMSVGFDYSYQGWGVINADSEIAGEGGSVDMKFRNTSAFRGGIEYTPQRFDIRRPLRRLTYRAGFNYSDYYMTFNNTNINSMGVTAGVGIPLKLEGNSYLDIGIEYGRRGTTKNELIKEDYFKVSVGFRLFGTDSWFEKFKFR